MHIHVLASNVFSDNISTYILFISILSNFMNHLFPSLLFSLLSLKTNYQIMCFMSSYKYAMHFLSPCTSLEGFRLSQLQPRADEGSRSPSKYLHLHLYQPCGSIFGLSKLTCSRIKYLHRQKLVQVYKEKKTCLKYQQLSESCFSRVWDFYTP